MQGIRPAVSGLISSAGISMTLLALFGVSTLAGFQGGVVFNPVALGIGVLAFIATRATKINPVIIILLSGLLGMLVYSFVPV